MEPPPIKSIKPIEALQERLQNLMKAGNAWYFGSLYEVFNEAL